jgi:hypothetical protein
MNNAIVAAEKNIKIATESKPLQITNYTTRLTPFPPK